MTASPQAVIESGALQRWLPYCRLNVGRPKVRLLCFPHAGGSARVFDKWPERLPWSVQVCAIQLPGREMRLNEPPITRMTHLLEEFAKVLLPWIDRPVALFGHSLGAKIANREKSCRVPSLHGPQMPMIWRHLRLLKHGPDTPPGRFSSGHSRAGTFPCMSGKPRSFRKSVGRSRLLINRACFK